MSLFAETTFLPLVKPNGEPVGLTLELVDANHDDVVTAMSDVVKAAKKAGVTDPFEVARSIEGRVKVLSAAVVGWTVEKPELEDSFKALGFVDATFSKEKLLILLSHKRAKYIRDQIDTAIGESERFFPTASKPSETP